MSFSLLFVVRKNDVGKLPHGYRQLKWLVFNSEE
jgi:hypothetical protein